MPSKLAEKCTPIIYLAPMAGITDFPYRKLVSSLGVGNVVSEMVASQSIMSDLVASSKKLKSINNFEKSVVQIVGSSPYFMTEAARYVESIGCNILDINMGCPAKKVNRTYAGAALMKDLDLAKQIIEAVVQAVNIPVTLKMRLGWNQSNRNALSLSRIAEDLGIKMVAIHARTRCQFFKNKADWSKIAEITKKIQIPVLVNGDIICSKSARSALWESNADGLMIGRGARGKPWLLKEVYHALLGNESDFRLSTIEKIQLVLEHYESILSFYGKELGIRLAK